MKVQVATIHYTFTSLTFFFANLDGAGDLNGSQGLLGAGFGLPGLPGG